MSLNKTLNFLSECKKELFLISWPKPNDVMFQFGVVLALSSFLVLLLYLSDLSLSYIIESLKETLAK